MDGDATLACRDPAICQGLRVLCSTLSKWPAAAASEEEALPCPCSTLPRIQSQLLKQEGERGIGGERERRWGKMKGKWYFFSFSLERLSEQGHHTLEQEFNYCAYPLWDMHKQTRKKRSPQRLGHEISRAGAMRRRLGVVLKENFSSQ